MIAPKELEGLPENVASVLADFTRSALQAFGADLKSIILYGSGAEARLRAASDVNLLLVLSSFDAAKADAIRGPFGVARAAIRMTAMFSTRIGGKAGAGAVWAEIFRYRPTSPRAVRRRSF